MNPVFKTDMRKILVAYKRDVITLDLALEKLSTLHDTIVAAGVCTVCGQVYNAGGTVTCLDCLEAHACGQDDDIGKFLSQFDTVEGIPSTEEK